MTFTFERHGVTADLRPTGGGVPPIINVGPIIRRSQNKIQLYGYNRTANMSDGHSLVLPDLTPEDSGTYECYLGAKVGGKNKKTWVTLLVPVCATQPPPPPVTSDPNPALDDDDDDDDGQQDLPIVWTFTWWWTGALRGAPRFNSIIHGPDPTYWRGRELQALTLNNVVMCSSGSCLHFTSGIVTFDTCAAASHPTGLMLVDLQPPDGLRGTRTQGPV
ncbi:hypothetical protein N1851_007294 [Merluccius polli]|uniref:Uncharacterized protein n=1 Tax=Merluccius polli TaxID=89951 RepID=A0AA47N326_MERPO|nr:hypothetical protein N1851_007294 [Merluccius polli]